MRKFAITRAKTAKTNTWGDATEFDIRVLGEFMTSHEVALKKDGMCFIAGGLTGNRRGSNFAQYIDLLVYDVDGKQTFDEVEELMDASGVMAFIYTSYNHLITYTEKRLSAYRNWADKHGEPTDPTAESLTLWLHAMGIDYHQNIRYNFEDPACSRVEESKSGEEDHYIIFHHDPVHKCRVVIPLKNRIIIDDLGSTKNLAINTYKSIYHGVGQALGLEYDRVCEDPSRVYYFPSRPPNEDPDDTTAGKARSTLCNDPDGWYFNPDDPSRKEPALLDYDKYPRVATRPPSMRQRTDGTYEKRKTGDTTFIDKDGVPINLQVWNRRHGMTFDIEGVLERTLGADYIIGDRPQGGLTIRCPFEDNHSSLGGQGTFAANGDGDRSWTIYCSHNTCNMAEERGKFDYLGEFINQGLIVAADLGISSVEDQRKALADALGVDSETLPKRGFTVNYGEDDGELPDETEVEKEIQDADADRPASEVYEECLKIIRDSERKITAIPALRRLLARGCEIIEEDIVEVLARSKLSGGAVKTILTKWARTDSDEIAADETLELVRAKRLELVPIEYKIKHLFDASIRNEKLEAEYSNLASYYMITVKDVKAAYEVYGQNLHKEKFNEDVQIQFDELTNRYAKVWIGHKLFFLDMLLSRDRLEPILRDRNNLSAEMDNSIVEYYEDYRDPKSGELKTKLTSTPLFKAWTKEVKNIRLFQGGVTMVPHGPESVDGAFNIWDPAVKYPYPVTPRVGNCNRLIDHIDSVWCNGDEALRNWVMMFFADIFQNPGKKHHSAIMLLGPSGTGKSLPIEHGLSHMLGKLYGSAGERDQVVGKFNAHIANKLLFLAEEVLFSGDKKAMDKLKDQITNTTTQIERKGIDSIQIPSYTRYVFTSNRVHALHLDPDDRRFCVLHTPQDERELGQKTEYFTSFRNWLETEGKDYWLDYLLKFKPEDYNLTWNGLYMPPVTSHKQLMIEMSVETADMFFMELLRYGRLDTFDEELADGVRVSWALDSPFTIKQRELKSLYEAYLVESMGSQSRYEKAKYPALFEKYVGMKVSEISKPIRMNGQLDRYISLPPRRSSIEYALKRHYITKALSEEALMNPDSHLYSTGSQSDILD